MSYEVKTTNAFLKQYKRLKKRGYDIAKLRKVVDLLEQNGTLPPRYKAHKLSGESEGKWECHIESDWLLIWLQNDTELVLLLLETGTHSDIF